MCPKKTTVGRHKRELFTTLAIIAIVAVCSAGVGVSAYAITEIGNVKMTQIEIERTLDDLLLKATFNREKIATLQEEEKKIAKSINNLITDVNDLAKVLCLDS